MSENQAHRFTVWERLLAQKALAQSAELLTYIEACLYSFKLGKGPLPAWGLPHGVRVLNYS